MSNLEIIVGDCRNALGKIPDESVHCCVTSPPYFGLRDYKVEGQIGLERTPDEFVSSLVSVFREVRRVLKNDGTLWVNLGDSYASGWSCNRINKVGNGSPQPEERRNKLVSGLKEKDLIGIPWMVAFALRADGWYLRSDIIWHKPNPMPESVRDRPTRAHEYIFLLTKCRRYFYDADAIKEPPSEELLKKQIADGYNGQATKLFEDAGVQNASDTKSRIIEGKRRTIDKQRGHSRRHDGFNDRWDNLTKEEQMVCGSNKRSVWTVAPANYTGAHFATFPPDLIKPCILAGCPSGETVLDPFLGSGTTGQVALELGRKCIGIELNPEYAELARQRCHVTPGLPL